MNEHWPDWYKDIVRRNIKRDRERLLGQTERAIGLGIWKGEKSSQELEKWQEMDDADLGHAVINMHKLFRRIVINA